MKLEIEMIPSGSWYKSLYRLLPSAEWDKIRKDTYAFYGHQCGICAAKSKLYCHEIWFYDEKKHIQSLKGFIALCDDCHMIKHMGFAGILAVQGKFDMEKLIGHFLRINNVSRKAYQKHHLEATILWKKRTRHEWKIDYGIYGKLLSSASPKPRRNIRSGYAQWQEN